MPKTIERTLENTYGKTVRKIYVVINPFKKIIIKTTCVVHKYINCIAIEILKKQGLEEEYRFFSKNIDCINEGTVWADQDFKSSNHFYHYETGEGLYGFSSALEEFKKYYNMSIGYLRAGDTKKSLFFLGAACHVAQDSTVPQHIRKRLLDNHRGFELWIIAKLASGFQFKKGTEIILEEDMEDYIKNNARYSNSVYSKYEFIKDLNLKNTRISEGIIPRAEMSTSGIMINYYKSYKKIQEIYN